MDTNFDFYYNKYVTNRSTHEEMMQEFRNILTAIFNAHENIVQIVFHGHTPSFNDGDACTHSEDITLVCKDGLYTEGYSMDCTFDDPEWSKERFDLTDEELNRTLVFDGEESVLVKMPVNLERTDGKWRRDNYGYPKPSGINKVVKLLNTQDVSSFIYNTNYVVVVERNEEGFDIETHDYWPSY